MIMARSIFQYVKSRTVRRRIYQVYIAPVIEWYLPVVMFKCNPANKKLNAVESFQHRMLCLVAGACQKVSSKELGVQMAEMPVHLKLGRMCSRLAPHLDRDINKLKGLQEGQSSAEPQVRSLRSGDKRIVNTWPGAHQKDFGDTLFIKTNEYGLNNEKD